MMMMMKTCFYGPLLLLFLCGSGSGLGSVVVKHYWYTHSHFTWYDAQILCSSSPGTNLATIFDASDEGRMYLDSYRAWIGLYRVSLDWWWTNGLFHSGGGGSSGSRRRRHKHPVGGSSTSSTSSTGISGSSNDWAMGEPLPSDNCASVLYNNDRLFGSYCGESYFFFCKESESTTVFVPLSKNWTGALDYCENHFIDLAYLAGSNFVQDATTKQDFPVWIGLHREGGTWKWSAGLSDYRNWATQEPSDRGDCVTVSSKDKTMSTRNCLDRFPIVCFRDNLVLVKENKTWEEALDHCRSLGFDLVSVQPGEDHEYVLHKVKEADTEEVWAGLRFLAGKWLWVNTAAMLYDLPLCPPMLLRCGALAKNDSASLLLADCTEKRNFLCYRAW